MQKSALQQRSVPPRLSAFGPGKVILLGEHAVVYGHTAVAGPLSLGVTARCVPSAQCELVLPRAVTGAGRALLRAAFERAAKACGRPKVRVSLRSGLPVSMGLGSSAAIAVACTRVLLEAQGEEATAERVAAIALEMEQEFHGTPSGIDHTVSSRNELLSFRRPSPGEPPEVRALQSPRPLQVVVVLAGPRPPTKVTVSALRDRQARWPTRYGRIFREMGAVAREGARAITQGDLASLGDAMNVNQGLLAAVGLSSVTLEETLQTLRDLGALGAKLTGAGGDGGAVMGLFEHPVPVVERLSRMGFSSFASQLAGPRIP